VRLGDDVAVTATSECRKIILGNVLFAARLHVHYIHKDYNQSMNTKKLITTDYERDKSILSHVSFDL
jgi:hypothetical protein